MLRFNRNVYLDTFQMTFQVYLFSKTHIMTVLKTKRANCRWICIHDLLKLFIYYWPNLRQFLLQRKSFEQLWARILNERRWRASCEPRQLDAARRRQAISIRIAGWAIIGHLCAALQSDRIVISDLRDRRYCGGSNPKGFPEDQRHRLTLSKWQSADARQGTEKESQEIRLERMRKRERDGGGGWISETGSVKEMRR